MTTSLIRGFTGETVSMDSQKMSVGMYFHHVDHTTTHQDLAAFGSLSRSK